MIRIMMKVKKKNNFMKVKKKNNLMIVKKKNNFILQKVKNKKNIILQEVTLLQTKIGMKSIELTLSKQERNLYTNISSHHRATTTILTWCKTLLQMQLPKKQMKVHLTSIWIFKLAEKNHLRHKDKHSREHQLKSLLLWTLSSL